MAGEARRGTAERGGAVGSGGGFAPGVGIEAEQQRDGDFLGGSPEKVPERYRAASPVELVPLGVRQRVFHGDRDDVVPPAMSRAYVAAARKSGDDCTLTEPEGVGHFELIDPRTAVWGQVRGAIERLLE